MSIDYREIAEQRIICPFCGAEQGQRCHTETGKPALTHTGRWDVVAMAYAAGYIDRDKEDR